MMSIDNTQGHISVDLAELANFNVMIAAELAFQLIPPELYKEVRPNHIALTPRYEHPKIFDPYTLESAKILQKIIDNLKSDKDCTIDPSIFRENCACAIFKRNEEIDGVCIVIPNSEKFMIFMNTTTGIDPRSWIYMTEYRS